MMATGRFMGDQLIAKIGRKKTLQGSGIMVFIGLSISVLFPWVVTATAGFANPGYTLNLSYSYRFEPYFGLGGEVFYNRYKLDEEKIKEVYSQADVDHWQFYGLTAGPVFSFDLSNGISSHLRVMGGAAYCNSPKATEDGDLVLNEEWSWSTIVKGGLGFSFEAGKKYCIILNVDYLYTKPGFDIKPIVGEIADRVHQRISAVNVTAGFGFRF